MAADDIILIPRDTVQASHSPREQLHSYMPHPTRRLNALIPNPSTMDTGLNCAQSEWQVSSTRWVNSTAASGVLCLASVKTRPRCLQVTPHAIKLATRRAIPVGVEICMNLTRIYIERFSLIDSQGFRQNNSVITVPRLLKGIGSPRSESVGAISICCIERCGDGWPGNVL